jgi:hypothetical protein
MGRSLFSGVPPSPSKLPTSHKATTGQDGGQAALPPAKTTVGLIKKETFWNRKTVYRCCGSGLQPRLNRQVQHLLSWLKTTPTWH